MELSCVTECYASDGQELDRAESQVAASQPFLTMQQSYNCGRTHLATLGFHTYSLTSEEILIVNLTLNQRVSYVYAFNC
jgi:hypothetical protein